MALDLPFLVEAEQLEEFLGHPDLLVVDVGDMDAFRAERIPNAVHVDYLDLVSGSVPTSGTLPPAEKLEALLSSIGLALDKHVVAYDAYGNGNASRLVWTLDVIDHPATSLLNGGFTAWKVEGHPIENSPPKAMESTSYRVHLNGKSQADKHYILSNLDNSDIGLLDARTPLEYEGMDVRALRGGHIPGARNVNWTDTIDLSRNGRFKPKEELLEMLDRQGLTPDKEIITYCQSHHRSSHSYAMLKSLGFPRVRGYAGSWSEWGNSVDTPVEQPDNNQ